MSAIQNRLPYLAPTHSLPPQLAYIYTFDFLAFTGLVTLAGVLATAMANEKIRRSGTWYSLIVSWMVYSAGYLLILGHQTGPAPAFGICALQATLVYGTPTLSILSFRRILVPKVNAQYCIYLFLLCDRCVWLARGSHDCCLIRSHRPIMPFAV
jgi:hypothetical protein